MAVMFMFTGVFMFELLFLFGLTLHNIEEALWLPRWSKYAGRYHKEVTFNEFVFAVIMVTAVGYLLTFQYFIFGGSSLVSKYLYLGFVAMMVLNAFMPHLAATIALRRYAPGTLTALLLNLPFGLYLLCNNLVKGELFYFFIAFAVVVVFTLFMIKICFRAGKKLLDL